MEHDRRLDNRKKYITEETEILISPLIAEPADQNLTQSTITLVAKIKHLAVLAHCLTESI